MTVSHVADDIVIAIDSIPLEEGLNAREREHKAEEKLLHDIVGDVVLTHNYAGKPFIDNYNISISHTVSRRGGFVAIMLSESHEVGIDIEYKSDRIMKIASRFLRPDENPQSVDDHLVCWCAKEAVYKLFSSEDLTYQQMKVDDDMSSVMNMKSNISVDIHYQVTDEYVIVYTYK